MIRRTCSTCASGPLREVGVTRSDGVSDRAIVVIADLLQLGRLELGIDDVHADRGKQALQFAVAADQQECAIKAAAGTAERARFGQVANLVQGLYRAIQRIRIKVGIEIPRGRVRRQPGHRGRNVQYLLLDWELSTLGHPLADFAYHAMMYHMPPHIVAGLAGANLPALNIPSEADYVAAYCRRTGRASLPDYRFYIAFNFFRLAAIFHGIKGRVIRGTAASAQAAERARVFPELAQIAWGQVEAV